MRRFLVKCKDYELKLYYKDEIVAKENNPDALIIEEIFDDYTEICNVIISKSCEKLLDYKGRTVYKIKLSNGYVLVRLYLDNNDNKYYDYCEYQLNENNKLVKPVTWNMSSLEKFYNKFIQIEPIEYNIVSFRKYGEPKLNKPKELKGIKQTGSIYFIPNKCKCEYFIKDNDIYIKHHDYFSPSMHKDEDVGTPLTYRIEKYHINRSSKDKFVYPDSWGDIVLRQEAWIKISNVIPYLKITNYSHITNTILNLIEKYHKFENNSLDYYWTQFIENMMREVNNII